MNVLLVGDTEGGRCAVLVEDATWRTVASVADGLTAVTAKPITWACHSTAYRNVNQALYHAGYRDDRPAPALTPA